MKKIILLSSILFASILSAQDYSKITKLNSTDYETALQLANEMSANSSGKYHFYKSHEFTAEKTLRIVYAPDGVTDEELKAKKDYSNCFVVDYKVKDSGTGKSYKLLQVRGKYADIFPTWRSWFVPTADEEKTQTSSSSRHLTDYNKKLEFYIEKTGNNWTLRNDS